MKFSWIRNYEACKPNVAIIRFQQGNSFLSGLTIKALVELVEGLMTFWEALTVAGLMTTIMGVFFTICGILNNRTLKEESRHTREILIRIEQGQEETRREIAQMMSEARKEMTEAIKYLADLIRVESQATREMIQGRS